MSEPTILNPVRLGFDPATTTEDRLDEVFADEEARKLWLLWRPGHLVNQHFGTDCLRVAMKIRNKKPKTPEALAQCLDSTHCNSNFTSLDVERFAPVALPYFTGEKTIEFTIERKT